MRDILTELPEDSKDSDLEPYSVGDPEHPNWYIYEYENHRKVLVERDPQSGKLHFVKEL